ncbi:hypothetical protein AWV80_16885 [Cupriavidus sp. UYMU48A]|nr:hypothetical protein AWV80_16885 [Cupriavidus sp. UYMU48A]
MLLDSVGAAFAAQANDMGRMCTDLSQRLGGQPEAGVLGSRGKVSTPNAAPAKGELIIFILGATIVKICPRPTSHLNLARK